MPQILRRPYGAFFVVRPLDLEVADDANTVNVWYQDNPADKEQYVYTLDRRCSLVYVTARGEGDEDGCISSYLGGRPPMQPSQIKASVVCVAAREISKRRLEPAFPAASYPLFVSDRDGLVIGEFSVELEMQFSRLADAPCFRAVMSFMGKHSATFAARFGLRKENSFARELLARAQAMNVAAGMRFPVELRGESVPGVLWLRDVNARFFLRPTAQATLYTLTPCAFVPEVGEQLNFKVMLRALDGDSETSFPVATIIKAPCQVPAQFRSDDA